MYTYTHTRTLTVTCHHREHPELSNEQLMKLLLVGASLNDVGIDVDTFAFSLRITVVVPSWTTCVWAHTTNSLQTIF